MSTNANTEKYFRTYKEEVAWLLGDPRYEELAEKAKEFERFYDEECPHGAIGYKGSKEVYEKSVRLYKKVVW